MADNREAEFNILQMVASALLVLGRQHGHHANVGFHLSGPSPIDAAQAGEERAVSSVRVRFKGVTGTLPGMWDAGADWGQVMRKWVFNFMVGVSLVLCVAMAGMWEDLRYQKVNPTWGMTSQSGVTALKTPTGHCPATC